MWFFLSRGALRRFTVFEGFEGCTASYKASYCANQILQRGSSEDTGSQSAAPSSIGTAGIVVSRVKKGSKTASTSNGPEKTKNANSTVLSGDSISTFNGAISIPGPSTSVSAPKSLLFVGQPGGFLEKTKTADVTTTASSPSVSAMNGTLTANDMTSRSTPVSTQHASAQTIIIESAGSSIGVGILEVAIVTATATTISTEVAVNTTQSEAALSG